MSYHRWSKRKGSDGERELIDLFWELGWVAHRIAGSGSSKYPSPDVLAGNGKRTLAIEAKVTKEDRKYFLKEEISALLEFSRLFGAEPWVSIKFGKESWLFFSLEDLKQTEKGWSIRKEDGKHKGLLIEEIISFS